MGAQNDNSAHLNFDPASPAVGPMRKVARGLFEIGSAACALASSITWSVATPSSGFVALGEVSDALASPGDRT